jgi:hypothetical protein
MEANNVCFKLQPNRENVGSEGFLTKKSTNYLAMLFSKKSATSEFTGKPIVLTGVYILENTPFPGEREYQLMSCGEKI